MADLSISPDTLSSAASKADAASEELSGADFPEVSGLDRSTGLVSQAVSALSSRTTSTATGLTNIASSLRRAGADFVEVDEVSAQGARQLEGGPY
ncbi:hypothetical protein [Actinomyces lilanjuaniae]|nr:hypothetical protein [Actinomyces lilanjuaniae]